MSMRCSKKFYTRLYVCYLQFQPHYPIPQQGPHLLPHSCHAQVCYDVVIPLPPLPSQNYSSKSPRTTVVVKNVDNISLLNTRPVEVESPPPHGLCSPRTLPQITPPPPSPPPYPSPARYASSTSAIPLARPRSRATFLLARLFAPTVLRALFPRNFTPPPPPPPYPWPARVRAPLSAAPPRSCAPYCRGISPESS